ncbi:copper chaperone PCu(A)C [Motilimonas eburnea]|uniref:copper chaperone PCu(A)C n=1 Tax=Motilimonas eburnea TaxID=1737488 RepID=UPI001E54F2E3|nr:copper chaperone PCu(A)C [Motilimonas eburnea]MCE2570838.1 copper chaperone PCu(A)C [Motilimonas eburnea]
MKKLLSLSVLGMMLLSGLAQAQVMIHDAYVRATPPNAQNSAAFLQLMNHSKEAVALVGASSDIAEKVELHNHIMADGMMKMRQVERIEVGPMETVSLQPGGYHIMLMGLHGPLKEDQEVEFTLTFASGETVSFTAPVKSINGKPAKMNHDH